MPRVRSITDALRRARWPAWLLLSPLLLYALYLIAANVFLNTAFGASVVNRKPERFQMQWRSGHSWWPGRVTLSGVALQGHAHRVDWSANARRVRGRIALWPLLRRELHVPQVEADDVDGRIDPVSRPAATAARAPAAGGWTLRFDRIATQSLRDARFGAWRLQGQGTAAVGFGKQLRGGWMELLPSTAQFAHARLTRGEQELLREGTLDARFAIARHTPAQARGLDKLLLADAGMKLQGTTAAVAIALDAKGQGSLRTVPGQGQATMDVAFARGALVLGSRVRWQMPLVSTDPKGIDHTDHVQVALDVDARGQGGDIRVKAFMPPQAGGAFGLDADLRVDGNTVPLRDLRALLPRTSGHLAGQWRFDSLTWLSRFFTKAPWLSLDGAGDVDADLQLSDGKLAAGSKITVPDVAAVAVVMDNRIHGRARAQGWFEAGADGALLPRLDVTMQRFDVVAADAPGRPYVQGSDLRLQLAASGVATVRESLAAHLTFANARVPDLRVYNRYLPNAHLRFDGGAGTLGGDLHLDAAGEVGHGTLRVAARSARMRVAGLALRGDVGIDTRLRRAELRSRRFAADGSTVDLRNVSFSEPGGESRSGWWARIALPRARLHWHKPLSVGGSAQVRMKDVGFLLALFTRKRDLPRWIDKVVDAGQARVTGRVQWQGDTLVLDGMEAHNDRYDLLARLRLRGQRRDGSLYAKWGIASVGVQLRGDQRKIHLLRARQWYDAQPALLR